MDVEKLLARVADNISVRRAFGTPYEKDGMLIIPVAIVAGGGGGGTGPGHRGNPATDPTSSPEDAGVARDVLRQGDSPPTEAGGGFGGLVLPSGAYIVNGDQVRWLPALDLTIAVLASLSLVRMLADAWTRSRMRRDQR